MTSAKDAAGECVLSSNTYSSRWTAMLDGFRSGDYLIIQFGINDGDSSCPRHVGTARFKTLLGVMASAAKARGVRPIFVTPGAAITCSGSTAVGNRGFLTETKDAAAANGVPVIDLHARSVALYNSLRLCPDNGDYTSGAVSAFFATITRISRLPGPSRSPTSSLPRCASRACRLPPIFDDRRSIVVRRVARPGESRPASVRRRPAFHYRFPFLRCHWKRCGRTPFAHNESSSANIASKLASFRSRSSGVRSPHGSSKERPFGRGPVEP